MLVEQPPPPRRTREKQLISAEPQAGLDFTRHQKSTGMSVVRNFFSRGGATDEEEEEGVQHVHWLDDADGRWLSRAQVSVHRQVWDQLQRPQKPHVDAASALPAAAARLENVRRSEG